MSITAKEVHEELVLESEILLEEAHNIVRDVTKKSAVADRMRALGFTSAKGVDRAESRAAYELRDRNADYAMKYPGLKFVPQEAMDRVCRKYDLVIGPLSNFTGDVPEWALELIEKNKHLWEKKPVDHPSPKGQMLMISNEGGADVGVGLAPSGEIAFIDNFRLDSFNRSFPSSDTVWVSGLAVPVASSIGLWQSTAPSTNIGDLCIAAPRKEMKVATNQIVVGYEIMNVRDPIVSLRVDGGFIVLAAWGEEGSDPAILNPVSN